MISTEPNEHRYRWEIPGLLQQARELGLTVARDDIEYDKHGPTIDGMDAYHWLVDMTDQQEPVYRPYKRCRRCGDRLTDPAGACRTLLPSGVTRSYCGLCHDGWSLSHDEPLCECPAD